MVDQAEQLQRARAWGEAWGADEGPKGPVQPGMTRDQAMSARANDYLERKKANRASEAAAAEASLARRRQAAVQAMTPAQQARARAQQEFIGAAEAARVLDAQRRTIRVENPLFIPVVDNVAEHRDADQREAAAGKVAALQQVHQADDFAAFQEDMAVRGAMEQTVAEGRERARNDRLNDQLEHVRKADAAVHRAADRLAETPGVDPGRYWASRTAGQKATAAISAALMGFAGRDPFKALHTAIADDIDAQKNAQGMAKAGMAGRQAEAGNARSVYAEVMAEVQDERAADLIMEQARLDQAKRQLQAMGAKHGAAAARPQAVALEAQIDKQMADNKLRLDTIQASNAPYRTKTVNTIGPNQRRFLRQAGEAQLDLGADLTKQGFKQAGDERKADMDVRARGANEHKRQSFEQRKFVAQQTAADRNEIRAIDAFTEKYGGAEGDIPGVSSLPLGEVGRHTMTADAREARELYKRIVKIRLREESGAAISTEELEDEAENVVNGMSEDDIWRSLKNRREEAQRRIDGAERAVDEPELEQYRRSVAPDFDPMADGATADPTVVDRR